MDKSDIKNQLAQNSVEMTEKYVNENNQVSQIVSMYRARQALTQSEFAEALTEKMSGSLTGAAVSFWEKGERSPNTVFLIQMGMKYSDWRGMFALDVLAATVGEPYAPRGDIGRHVLLGEPLGEALEVAASVVAGE